MTVAVALALGCGEGTQRPAAPAPVPVLSERERAALRAAEARVQAHCVSVARSLVDPGAAPTPAEEARAFAAADRLVVIVSAKPRAVRDVGQDLRLYLGDVVENLEGSNCDPRMIDRLERALARIPPD